MAHVDMCVVHARLTCRKDGKPNRSHKETADYSINRLAAVISGNERVTAFLIANRPYVQENLSPVSLSARSHSSVLFSSFQH